MSTIIYVFMEKHIVSPVSTFTYWMKRVPYLELWNVIFVGTIALVKGLCFFSPKVLIVFLFLHENICCGTH